MSLYGVKTFYNGHFLKVVSKNENFELIFEGSDCQLEGFKKYADNIFFKAISRTEIKNAFYFTTYASFKSFKFQVDKIIGKKIRLTTSDKNAFDTLKLEFVDRGWYEVWVNINEIDKLWEERKPSCYNLPMPDGLNEHQELKISDNDD